MKNPGPRIVLAASLSALLVAALIFTARQRGLSSMDLDLRDSVGEEGIRLDPGHASLGSDHGSCRYCHLPHRAQGARPLWAAGMAFGSGAPAPETAGLGATSSELCLSCHAATATAFRQAHAMPSSGGLNSPHPVGVDYGAASRRDPSSYIEAGANPRIVLENGKVGCVSCHAVHDRAAVAGHGLRHEVCIECHRR